MPEATPLSAKVLWLFVVFVAPVSSAGARQTIDLSDPTNFLNGKFVRLACFGAVIAVDNDPSEDNDAICQNWTLTDDGAPTDVLHCPPLLNQTQADDRFVSNNLTEVALEFFHPGAEESFRQKMPSPSGAGQECVYKDGKLLVGPKSGGRVDSVSPEKDIHAHWRQDVKPWCHCCAYNKKPESCEKYYEIRPSDPGTEYVAP